MNSIEQNIINVNFNNINIKIPKYTLVKDFIKNNSNLIPSNVVALKINNEYANYNQKIDKDCNIDFIDINSITGYKIYQAGLKFVLEVALKNVFGKNVIINYNHSIGNGVYTTINNYDFKKEDIDKLKNEMNNIIQKNEEFQKVNVNALEAMTYYYYHDEIEKAANIHNYNTNIITLFKLENYINYFYCELPYKTGCLKDYDLVYLKDNELALLMPSSDTFSLVDYNKYDNVIECFKYNKKVLDRYNLPFIYSVNQMVSQGYSKELIMLLETNFNNEINNMVNNIIKLNKKFMFIAGPSSSGKTTTAKKIALNFQTYGYMPILISTDDYFVDKVDSPKNDNGEYDFESIDCVDIEKLNSDLRDLLDGKEIILPKYNFKKGIRELSDTKVKLKENTIILIEGIHCLNDKLIKNIDKDLIYRIYLSPFISVKIDRHNYLSTTDLRLIRRIIRDNNNRGTSVLETIKQWKNVRIGEEKNIFEFIDKADIIINTSLAYELGVLKVYVEPLLYSIRNDAPEIGEAQRLIKFFNNIYSIPSEYVPYDSIIREFIGGSFYKGEGDK